MFVLYVVDVMSETNSATRNVPLNTAPEMLKNMSAVYPTMLYLRKCDYCIE
jgi:hypothetical protein